QTVTRAPTRVTEYEGHRIRCTLALIQTWIGSHIRTITSPHSSPDLASTYMNLPELLLPVLFPWIPIVPSSSVPLWSLPILSSKYITTRAKLQPSSCQDYSYCFTCV
ncbi:hypothetical protein cypCar_00038563, partial [Cyprinus carpio]